MMPRTRADETAFRDQNVIRVPKPRQARRNTRARPPCHGPNGRTSQMADRMSVTKNLADPRHTTRNQIGMDRDLEMARDPAIHSQ